MNKKEAYEKLRVRIVTNGVAPGEILNEKELMAQLAIGRSPLREILFRLQEENLIKPLPRLGYMGTTVDLFEVRDLVELRRELEGYAGYL
ncbi:MAG: GntR family transcriptional regulator, partial [Deltaproteobacteria bacterium]|nr:GntR family transcriptional regulator [Deltaproteobacteria bacterium]